MHPYIYPLALHRRATQDGTRAAREPLGTPGPIREVLSPGEPDITDFNSGEPQQKPGGIGTAKVLGVGVNRG